MNVIEFNKVWKKFNKGEKLNSLRDAIPGFFRRTITGANGALKEYEFWALREVSFEIQKGEVVGIIGPNGAGKSTILKLLSRILSPNKGDIKIKGRLSALIEVTAGFHPELTGRENVYLNGTILGMRRKEIDGKFDEIVDFAGVAEFIDTPVKRYSSGMFARLGFSVAAHMDPDILLVDEVLAVGDLNFQAKCAQKMRSLLKSNTTIVLVSHNLSLVQSICKRVIMLDKGVLSKIGSPEEVSAHYQSVVFERQEEELKKRSQSSDYKIRLQDNSSAKILKVDFLNEKRHLENTFGFGEKISLKVEYQIEREIEEPVFVIEISRADGVLCCLADTKSSTYKIANLKKNGSIIISLGNNNLAPGIYLTAVYILDKDIIHLHTHIKKDIFKIVSEFAVHSNPVFLPEVGWKLE